MSAKPRAPRLSPNKRAELISRYSKGESLDDDDYYVIKDKSGRLNVRKRKSKSEHPEGCLATKSQSSDEGKKEEVKEAPQEAPEETPKKDKKEPKTKAL